MIDFSKEENARKMRAAIEKVAPNSAASMTWSSRKRIRYGRKDPLINPA